MNATMREKLKDIVEKTEVFQPLVPSALVDAVGNPILFNREYVMSHKPPNFGWYGGVQNFKFFLVHDWGQAYVVSGKTLLEKPNWIINWDAILLADVGEVAEKLEREENQQCLGDELDAIRPSGFVDKRSVLSDYSRKMLDLQTKILDLRK